MSSRLTRSMSSAYIGETNYNAYFNKAMLIDFTRQNLMHLNTTDIHKNE